jgi:beta-galactosidase
MIKRIHCIALASVILIQCGNQKFSKRQSISLNGTWDVEESISDEMPKTFSHQVLVPGIIDMASPSFDSAGLKCRKRNYYWFCRQFTIDKEIPPVVLLKINKAMYGTKVFINGKEVGNNHYCFTPSYFNIRDFVKAGEKNEIMVRLGAYRDNLPDSIPDGRDYEKIKYFSGIYDDVNIILSDFPYIENVQIVPDIDKKQIRVVAEINSDKEMSCFKLEYQIEEAKSGDKYISAETDSMKLSKGINKIDFIVPINDCHLWSPEDPFLYKLNLATGNDSKSQRFGMRTFHFDKKRKLAVLNGKPYALLGTNVCIFRFFEDSLRGNLPWQEEWIRKLHLQFKNMNWNCIRYTLGFPPEKWYDIADETGMLIQDEYPVWSWFEPIRPNERILAEEYKRWMRERWNHPCVVIWDAQNETNTDATGKAIQMVRKLDLSNRPWDNGFSPPQSDEDCIESHPYLFERYCGFFDKFKNIRFPSEQGYMKDLFDTVRMPFYDPNEFNPPPTGRYENPVIANEYDYLWINRDGSSTHLTDSIYKYVFGDNLTTEQRRLIHAENVAVLTEYWRCHRKLAGLMHFCGLTYSRPHSRTGATSDDFIDIKNLVYEPNFFRIVKPKFALVCNMIDKWGKNYKSGEKLTVPVYFINDQTEDWKGISLLYIQQNEKSIIEVKRDVSVKSFGQTIEKYDIQMPEKPGEYKLISEIYFNNDTIRSVRKFEIK